MLNTGCMCYFNIFHMQHGFQVRVPEICKGIKITLIVQTLGEIAWILTASSTCVSSELLFMLTW